MNGVLPSDRDRDLLHDLVDDLVRRDAAGACLVAQRETVTQAIVEDGLYVLGRDVISTLQPRLDARAFVERKRAARARADSDPILQLVAIIRGRRVAAINATM